jgi:ectoine hydroxylase-related dioxygenase (phytanoyl-CoA dioxygenase family)
LEDYGRFLGPHTDQVCQQLNACGYLEDVNPRNGGFTVYPGSHKRMFREHRYEANWSPLSSFRDTLKEIAETIVPYEIVAEKGSVVFWHGRTIHSAGIHLGGDIRWALFADFTRNQPVLTDEEHKDANQYEWFKDAKLFRTDKLVGDDMWRSWRLGG